jgi:hypothetical protein
VLEGQILIVGREIRFGILSAKGELLDVGEMLFARKRERTSVAAGRDFLVGEKSAQAGEKNRR